MKIEDFKKSDYCTELESKGFLIEFEATECLLSSMSELELDQEMLDLFNERIENGDLATWFDAKVTVTHVNSGLRAVDYLGACSYESFDAFTGADGDYFDDMLTVCMDDLSGRIEYIKGMLNEY